MFWRKIKNLFINNYKDLIIEDLLKTVKRQNKELTERIEFESRLIEHINNFKVNPVKDKTKSDDDYMEWDPIGWVMR